MEIKARHSYWHGYWRQFKKQRLGYFALLVVLIFCCVGIYAPFLASSRPLMVVYEGTVYFPLFRYLFYPEFFSKRLDLFFNLLIFTFPLMLFCLWSRSIQSKGKWLLGICLLQVLLFLYVCYRPADDPAGDSQLAQEHNTALKLNPEPSWNFDLRYMNSYAKLNLLLRYRLQKEQHQRLSAYLNAEPHTLFYTDRQHDEEKLERQKKLIQHLQTQSQGQNNEVLNTLNAEVAYIKERQEWLETESSKLHFIVMPLLSHFHWQDDAGGGQSLNQELPWWELTRINRKDLLAALIFGVRISLVVGLLSVAIALVLAIPIGAVSGFYGGTTDIIVCRLIEVWEAMPTFFMLLMVVGIIQSKSIFIVIAIIGFFGWTGFSRFLRGEFFKQRNLPYVEACMSLGYSDRYIMFVHILPNAIPPVLTLLPFAIMGAISSEAGLSFLGLGEESSCSWGVLMDEGRSAFPGESNLLWPPAILLTTLLVAIALVGDALRDTFDPKMHKV